MLYDRRQALVSALACTAVVLMSPALPALAADTAPNDVANVTLAVPGMT